MIVEKEFREKHKETIMTNTKRFETNFVRENLDIKRKEFEKADIIFQTNMKNNLFFDLFTKEFNGEPFFQPPINTIISDDAFNQMMKKLNMITRIFNGNLLTQNKQDYIFSDNRYSKHISIIETEERYKNVQLLLTIEKLKFIKFILETMLETHSQSQQPHKSEIINYTDILPQLKFYNDQRLIWMLTIYDMTSYTTNRDLEMENTNVIRTINEDNDNDTTYLLLPYGTSVTDARLKFFHSKYNLLNINDTSISKQITENKKQNVFILKGAKHNKVSDLINYYSKKIGNGQRGEWKEIEDNWINQSSDSKHSKEKKYFRIFAFPCRIFISSRLGFDFKCLNE